MVIVSTLQSYLTFPSLISMLLIQFYFCKVKFVEKAKNDICLQSICHFESQSYKAVIKQQIFDKPTKSPDPHGAGASWNTPWKNILNFPDYVNEEVDLTRFFLFENIRNVTLEQ